MNFIAIDLSLNSTGIAFFQDNSLSSTELRVITSKIKPKAGNLTIIPLEHSTDIDDTGKNKTRADRGTYWEITTRYDEISRKIVDVCKRLRNEHGVDMVMFEGLSFGSSGNSIFDIGRATGITQYRLYKEGFQFETIPPTVVKKLVTGKGNSPKNIVALKVYKLYNLDLSEYGKCAEDLYDAIAVGHAYLTQNMKGRSSGANSELPPG